MKVKKTVMRLREQSKRFGTKAVVHEVQQTLINKMIPFYILKGMTVEVGDIAPKMFDSGPLSARFATLDELTRACANREIAEQMSFEFARDAIDNGDECLGLFDGDEMVSYGWYATRPSTIDSDLVLHFGPSWVYMFKGYTKKSHRGKRLHGIGMSLAAAKYTDRGYRGLISYVRSDNFASLRSVTRMGYHIFGEVYVARPMGRVVTLSSSGCQPYSFRVARRYES